MRFTVACVQFHPEKGNVERNLDRIAEIVIQSSKDGADVVVFPETATTGYFLQGGVTENSLTRDDLAQKLSTRLGDLAAPVDIVLGFYEMGEGLVHNSMAYLEAGPSSAKIVHVHRKFFLPTYGVFDEERFVSAGTDIAAFDSRLGRVATLICEDVWHSITPMLVAVQGAEVIYISSASPARGFDEEKPRNLKHYENALRAISEEHGVFCVNSQLCGFEGGKGFPGGGMIVDPEGRDIAQSPILEEHVLMAELDLGKVRMARASLPLIGDLKTRWADVVRIAERS